MARAIVECVSHGSICYGINTNSGGVVMMYTIWVGGVEVNSHLTNREEAYRIASNWRNDGYSDVVVERYKPYEYHS